MLSMMLLSTSIVSAQVPEVPSFTLNTEDTDSNDKVTMNKDITLKIAVSQI